MGCHTISWLSRDQWLLILWIGTFWMVHAAKQSPYMQQSWFFELNPGNVLQVPTTPQCEPLHITWDRHSATGPSGVAPYSLQVFTSAYVFPFVIPAGNGPSFDWNVPFAPGTQFQICMFDVNGNTGGCQLIYTVTNSSSTCTNATFPLGPLGVEARDSVGPLSQYAWVDSCTDISVKPTNGTPPYTFTIAPSLHPPRNITIDSMKAANWTVDLSWASPFFLSVSDSASPMNFWSYGPIHSGDGDTACLDNKKSNNGSKQATSHAPTIGAGVGGLVVGILAGVVAAWVFMRRRERRRQMEFMHVHNSDSPVPLANEFGGRNRGTMFYNSDPSSHLPEDSLGSANTPGPHYHIEPFVMPSDQPHSPEPRSSHLQRAPSSFAGSDARSPTATVAYHDPFGATSGVARPGSSATHQTQQPQSVYVVHHDGGKAPVTVYVQDGADVVELPPRYAEDGALMSAIGEGSQAGSGSDGRGGAGGTGSELRSDGGRSDDLPAALGQQRRPNQQQKPQHSLNYDHDPLS